MKNAKTILMLSAVLMFVAGTALADWNPGDGHKMHFPQLPDLEYGLDVLAGWYDPGPPDEPYQKILADDWRCTETGPVTDIHIWGSYLNDFTFPGVSVFRLAIYNDIPNGPNGHSVPGELLWEDVFDPARYIDRIYAEAYEEFFDPNLNEIIGSDTQVWQYNFDIDPEVAFFQEEGNRVTFFVEYKTELFTEKTIERFITYFKEIISAVVDNRKIILKDIKISHELLSAAAKQEEIEFEF